MLIGFSNITGEERIKAIFYSVLIIFLATDYNFIRQFANAESIF